MADFVFEGLNSDSYKRYLKALKLDRDRAKAKAEKAERSIRTTGAGSHQIRRLKAQKTTPEPVPETPQEVQEEVMESLQGPSPIPHRYDPMPGAGSTSLVQELLEERKKEQLARHQGQMFVPRTIKGPNGKFFRNPAYRAEDEDLTGAGDPNKGPSIGTDTDS